MYFSKVICPDIANGLGCRCTLFISGCNHHCSGCFNPETWNFFYGKEFTGAHLTDIFDKLAPYYISGLTLLGGEPLEPNNQYDVFNLLTDVRSIYGTRKDIWLYTGCTWEELFDEVHSDYCCKITSDLLSMVDILVDGRFIEDLKDPSLKFRGSSNQRIIKCKDSIKLGKLILSELNN